MSSTGPWPTPWPPGRATGGASSPGVSGAATATPPKMPAGVVVDATWLDSYYQVDLDAGVVTVGAGVSLQSLMERLVPLGWFVPVTPGTRLVTVGGAIASDIHGKNHHVDGSFCSHVEEMSLVTPDGTRTVSATVGPGTVLGHGRRHGPHRHHHPGHAPDGPGRDQLHAGGHRTGKGPRHRHGHDDHRRSGLPLLGGLDRLPGDRWPAGSLRPDPRQPCPIRGPARTPTAAAGAGPRVRPKDAGPGARHPSQWPAQPADRRGLQRVLVPQGACAPGGQAPPHGRFLPPARRGRGLEPPLRHRRDSSSTSSWCPTTRARPCAR